MAKVFTDRHGNTFHRFNYQLTTEQARWVKIVAADRNCTALEVLNSFFDFAGLREAAGKAAFDVRKEFKAGEG